MLIKVIDAINEAVGRIVSLFAGVFAAIIIYEVVVRLMGNPTRWAFDMSSMIYGFYFIMLGGYALRHQAHVRVDLLTEKLSGPVRRWVEIIGYVVFFLPFTFVFMIYSWQFGLRSWAQGEVTSSSVQLPVYPLKLAMAIAATLLFIQGISELMKLIVNRDDHLETLEPLDVR
ncbi:MAG: TRAP transporter small permease subunit [Paracoccus sp. (in: a-proteobacteria)]|nr:TRAP transporter small permease subunit [Paracoccus sp. (in: a-proteobacteria)]